MIFGSCCYSNGNNLLEMNAKSVKIEGLQVGLIVHFEVTQTFINSDSEPKEIHYVFPNDYKICIYDTTFVVGEEVIKPKLQEKEEANNTYQEAINAGYTAVLGSNSNQGITKFKIGNLPPETECKIILQIAFTAQMTKENSYFIKFPLDVFTPSGSCHCLNIDSSEFLFNLQCEKENISKVTSNVKNFEFNEDEKICSISNKIENLNNEHSIIVTFETKEPMKSNAIIGSTINDYDTCAITISPNISPSVFNGSKEFIFLVDCSGSMEGNSIKKASECLEIFIRSLPSNSLFNIIRFGTKYVKLFDYSVKYDENTANEGIQLAQTLKADLGGTNIFGPLSDIFKSRCYFAQRQVFILTDGEVGNAGNIIELVRSNSNKNRCFTIGIGRGCDAGLVEGIANASGGKCDFVQEGDSISEKVIPQLKSSIYPLISSIEVHLAGEENDAFEISPFPIPCINSSGSSILYLRTKRMNKEETENSFNDGMLITGNYQDKPIEIQIEEIITKHTNDGIGKAILPLFTFNILKYYERKRGISIIEKKKAVEISILSGVLCKFTAYVGVSESTINIKKNYCFKRKIGYNMYNTTVNQNNISQKSSIDHQINYAAENASKYCASFE